MTMSHFARFAAAFLAFVAWLSLLWTFKDYSYGGTALRLGIEQTSLFYTHWATGIGALAFSLMAAKIIKPTSAFVSGGLVIIFSIILLQYWHFSGVEDYLRSPLRSKLVHLFLPVGVIFYFLVFTRRGELKVHHPFIWMTMPAFYAVVGVSRGLLTGQYPYPQSNIEVHGFPYVAGLLIASAIFAACLGYLLLGIDRLLLWLASSALPNRDIQQADGVQ